MQDTSKYLIHADIAADGVVERSDVVGAIFGQTEGLLGADLELRSLQDASKVGRIHVEIDSENGQSFGTVTIASGLDKVETAILAAALETIDRIGPCRATLSVAELEDVRSAKRREVVERAKTLLAEAFEGQMDSADIVAEVRRSVRVEDVTDFNGLPAGPRVADSDAIIIVEGRADVLTLLEYGVKNAVAVEGTNVPDAVADLTTSRTVTAFLDGDRGGDLILRELTQVGDVDYVAIAPPDHAVEDLGRGEAMAALREKVPIEAVLGSDEATLDDVAVTDGSVLPAPDLVTEPTATDAPEAEPTDSHTSADPPETADHPATLDAHIAAVIDAETGLVRLLDSDMAVLDEAPAEEAHETLLEADPVPETVVLDGPLDQRLLDVAAQRGVGRIIPRAEGEFVKKPTAVRVTTAATVTDSAESGSS